MLLRNLGALLMAALLASVFFAGLSLSGGL